MKRQAGRRAAWLLCASLLTACGAESARAKESVSPPLVPVRTASIVRGPVELPVRASGTLGARHELELSFKVGGVVREVRFEEGARVKKGQLLASVDPTEIEAQLAQAQQTLDKAERDTTRPASRRCRRAGLAAPGRRTERGDRSRRRARRGRCHGLQPPARAPGCTGE
ncbi:MAG: hypothetical protein RLZZ450_7693, partial [Pseudomonadota bacterium]